MAPHDTQWLRAGVYLSRGLRNGVIDLRRGRRLLNGRWRRPGGEAEAHQNSDHAALRRIFRGRVRPGDVLVDIGCGRGRVLDHWLSHFPGHRIIGIELDPDVAAETARRLRRHENCTVLSGDALELLPLDGTLFYLYNPFGPEQVTDLRSRLAARPRSSRPVVVLYHHPKHLEAFADRPGWQIEHVALGGSRLAPFDDLAVITRTY